MKDIILKKTGEAFLKFGFKSVTMDDIADKLAISKKTIYKHLKNKQDLVDQTVLAMHEECFLAIDHVCSLGINAIHENFEVKKIFTDLLKNADTSPMYQLQKYYPKTYDKILKKEFAMFRDYILRNIKKGINEGLYRKDIDENLVTRFYFSLIMRVHNSDLFTYHKSTINQLEINVLEYHTRAIATKDGIKELEKQLEELKNNK